MRSSRTLILRRRAITRSLAAVLVIILVVAAAAGIYYVTQSQSTSSSTSSSSSLTTASSTAASSSGPSYSTTSSSSGTQGGVINTLSIDSWSWPFPNDLSVLNTPVSPWPEWQYGTVYQTLVTVNDTLLWGSGQVQFQPGLAVNYTTSGDNTTYTFNLRHNVQFSNGDPFNAYQLWLEFYGVYYLNGNSSTWLNNYNVFNYTGVNFGPSTLALFNQSGVINPSPQALSIMENSSWPIYVTGPYQLVMHLSGPFDWLPGTLLTYAGLVYDTQYVLDHGGFGTPSSPNIYFNQNPIPGTGPYVVSQISEDSYVKFTQSPNYWGDSLTAAEIKAQPLFDPGHVKNVIVYAKTDDVSRYIDLSQGTVQISDIESNDWSLVTSNPQFGYVKLPSWAGLVSLLGLNTQVYPTNITLVRQAIVHAINYTDLYDTAYLGQMSPYVGPEYPAWSQFYDLGGLQPYQYNVTLAEQDLAEANVTNMPTFTLRIETGCEACINGAQVVQTDLAQIGIDVDIVILSGSQYLSVYGSYTTTVQDAQQIGQLSWVDGGEGWGAFALTPADYWVSFVSNQSLWGNWAAYSNPTVQACVNAFTQTSNVTEIQQLCTAAQQQIYSDAPYAWVGTFGLWLPTGGSTAYNKNVISGFLLDPTWGGQSSLPIFNTVTFTNGQ